MIRALLVEDNPSDAELVHLALSRYFAGRDEVVVKNVWTEPDLALALREAWDIVICDYSLPSLTWPRPLHVIRPAQPDLPVILVTGSIPFQKGLTSANTEATEYISKDQLNRLGEKVERHLRLVQALKANAQAASSLQDSLGKDPLDHAEEPPPGAGLPPPGQHPASSP